MCTEHKESQNLQIIFFRNFSYGKEISKRFGHLVVVDVQESIMHPVFCKLFSICSFTLCNLILMMREYKVLTTGMNIDLLAQVFLGHNGAFNMPSRSSVAPWRFPERFPFFLWFPEYEVKRIFFLIFTGYLQGTES